MESRPSLPASSSDFALPPSTTALVSSPLTAATEEFNPLLNLRFRRPSLLAPAKSAFYSEGRLHSPLVSSFTVPRSRRYTSSTVSGEESESDKDKMSTDSPSPSVDSGATTPLTPSLPSTSAFAEKDKSSSSVDSDMSMKSATSENQTSSSLATDRPRSPSTPPPWSPLGNEHETAHDGPLHRKLRRLSHPVSASPARLGPALSLIRLLICR